MNILFWPSNIVVQIMYLCLIVNPMLMQYSNCVLLNNNFET